MMVNDYHGQLRSGFGFRSLATTDKAYLRNHSNHSTYCGDVFISYNYLLLRALKTRVVDGFVSLPRASHVGDDDNDNNDDDDDNDGNNGGDRQLTLRAFYNEMREKVVKTVMQELRQTGTVWESYDSENGRGKGKRDSYWSSAMVLLLMTESYD